MPTNECQRMGRRARDQKPLSRNGNPQFTDKTRAAPS
jgi:hypothetical protein